MSLYHSKPTSYFLSIGSKDMNTIDAVDSLEKSIENLKGLVPSSTGTPISPAPRIHLAGDNAGGGMSSQNTPPAISIHERNMRAEKYLDRKATEESQRLLAQLSCAGVVLVLMVVLGPVAFQ